MIAKESYRLSQRLVSTLSARTTTYLVLLAAVVVRVIQLVFFYNIRVDASFQVMATQNFVYGHGVSIANADPNDLVHIIYTPLINWPPGYSWLLAPFYWLFRPDYMAAGITLDIIAAILFIFYSRGILRLLTVPVHLLNLFTLLSAFFIYYFYFIASSDAIAIALFLGAIFHSLRLVQVPQDWKKQTAFIGIYLVLSAYIKYLFIPVVFMVPTALWLGCRRDQSVKRASWIIFGTLILFLSALLVYQKMNAGTSVYVSSTGRGWYPDHLKGFYPFIIASFLKPDSLALFSRLSESAIYLAFQILTLILACFAPVFLLRKIVSTHGTTSYTGTRFFIMLSMLLIAAVVAVLAALSLRVEKEQILPGMFWTYIEEPRYFGLACILIQINAFLFITARRSLPIAARMILFTLLAGLALEAARGAGFIFNRIRLAGKEEYSWQYEHRIESYANSLLQKRADSLHTKHIAITGSWYYINHRIAIYGHLPLLHEAGKINDPTALKAKAPTLVFVCIADKDKPLFDAFLKRPDIIQEGKLEGYYFYSFYVSPG